MGLRPIGRGSGERLPHGTNTIRCMSLRLSVCEHCEELLDNEIRWHQRRILNGNVACEQSGAVGCGDLKGRLRIASALLMLSSFGTSGFRSNCKLQTSQQSAQPSRHCSEGSALKTEDNSPSSQHGRNVLNPPVTARVSVLLAGIFITLNGHILLCCWRRGRMLRLQNLACCLLWFGCLQFALQWLSRQSLCSSLSCHTQRLGSWLSRSCAFRTLACCCLEVLFFL